ncbi:MAG: ATP-binding protein [Rickettsiales bacterium]|jgi:type II secretory pathway predicted ATPase ExeA|nr:ATP-binding protein [Rickettsiales bacterium]
MSYVNYFHFDAPPFPAAGPNNYFFGERRRMAAASDIVARIRVSPGIYAVIGSAGVGKTVLLKSVWRELRNNDWTVFISASERTDILRAMADVLMPDSRRKTTPDVFPALEKVYRKGQNVVVLIDDADGLSAAAKVCLASLISAVPYIRVVLSGGRGLKKLLADRKFPAMRGRMVAVYRIRHLPYFSAVRYINDISVAALSLSQYKKVIPVSSALAIAFAANRSMRSINVIATAAIEDAWRSGVRRVGLGSVLRAVRAHWGIARENIYQKFKKIFAYLLALLSLYYVVKIFADRKELIQAIEVRQSIEEQEKSFEGMTLGS